MGGIIGVGVFFTPQLAAARVGEPWAFVGVWVFCGFVAMCAAFTFAELGATFPSTGGWFVYLREAFGRFPAFLFAWVVLGVVTTGATAAVAKFGVGMLHTAFPGSLPEAESPAGIAFAAAIVLAITGIGLAGVKRAALIQNLCMVTKLLAILALTVCGFLVWSRGDGPELAVQGVDLATSVAATAEAPTATTLIKGMLAALTSVFFAYGGWQMVGYIAPEVVDPVRTLPRAIVFGVLGVIIVYVVVNVAFVSALGVDGLAQDPQFAATIARTALGENGERILAGCMAISALGWSVVGVITAPWLYVAMAREGLFFRRVGRLHATRGVPTTALLLQAAVTIAYLYLPIGKLVEAVVFIEWPFHGLAALALLRLRRSSPELPRPYRSPLYPLAPVVYLIAAILVIGSDLWIKSGPVTGIGLGVLGSGIVAYFVWRRSSATA